MALDILLRRTRAVVRAYWLSTLLLAGLAIVAGPRIAVWLAAWTIDGVLAVSATVALIGGGVVVGQWAVVRIRWERPPRLPSGPIPDGWADIVRANLPLSRRLTDERFEHLLRLTQAFVAQKRFEGAGGLEISDEIRVTIAAQACMLLLELPVGVFPGLHTVIVYPAAFVPRRVGDSEPSPRVATFGESWGMGVVVLSWDSVLHGAFDARDGRNVVLHEFAHQLDQATGETDGVPIGLAPSTTKTWAGVIGRRYDQLRRARRKGRKSVMDQYGAKNRAEFFAVAAETFLEKPHQLQKSKPDLYDALIAFFGWDPINELKARSGQPKGSR